MTSGSLQLPAVGSNFADQFELLEVIGEGGMGVVYRARQLKLQREVALKVLRPEVLAKGYEQHRVQREALSAAKFRSHHVVRIYDWGISREGFTFLVMELLQGETLAQFLEREPALSPCTMAAWLQQCAEALDEAATLGVVHRDIKPANLFLAAMPGGGMPEIKILDFGITKFFDRTRSAMHHEVTTRSNLRLGTTYYMSPEQLRATSDVAAQADIWSLGVVVYKALSGRYPFERESEADLIVSILSDEPTPLPALDSRLSPALGKVVARALAKDVRSRYQTAGEFSRALTAALRDDPAALYVAPPALPAATSVEAFAFAKTESVPPLETRASTESARGTLAKSRARPAQILLFVALASALCAVLVLATSKAPTKTTELRTLPRSVPSTQPGGAPPNQATGIAEHTPTATPSPVAPAQVKRPAAAAPTPKSTPALPRHVDHKPALASSTPLAPEFERNNPYAN